MKFYAVVNESRKDDVGLGMNYQPKFQAKNPLCLINGSMVYRVRFSQKIPTETI